MSRLRRIALAFIVSIAAASSALAQDVAKYPEQLVRIVVPFSAGSMADLLARVVADKLQQRWGKEVIVENRPGLAGTASVAKGGADGYTLMLTSNGHSVISHLNKNLAFDPVTDFVGVTQVAITPLIMVVPPDSPAKSVKELIALEKAKPGALNYSSAGLGSTTGIAGALFKQTTKTEIRARAVQGPAGNAHGPHPRRRGGRLLVLLRGGRPHSEREGAGAGRHRLRSG